MKNMDQIGESTDRERIYLLMIVVPKQKSCPSLMIITWHNTPGDAEIVAAHAVRVNVFHTIDFLLKYSAPIREKVKNGQLEIQGLQTGRISWFSPHFLVRKVETFKALEQKTQILAFETAQVNPKLEKKGSTAASWAFRGKYYRHWNQTWSCFSGHSQSWCLKFGFGF